MFQPSHEKALISPSAFCDLREATNQSVTAGSRENCQGEVPGNGCCWFLRLLPACWSETSVFSVGWETWESWLPAEGWWMNHNSWGDFLCFFLGHSGAWAGEPPAQERRQGGWGAGAGWPQCRLLGTSECVLRLLSYCMSKPCPNLAILQHLELASWKEHSWPLMLLIISSKPFEDSRTMPYKTPVAVRAARFTDTCCDCLSNTVITHWLLRKTRAEPRPCPQNGTWDHGVGATLLWTCWRLRGMDVRSKSCYACGVAKSAAWEAWTCFWVSHFGLRGKAWHVFKVIGKEGFCQQSYSRNVTIISLGVSRPQNPTKHQPSLGSFFRGGPPRAAFHPFTSCRGRAKVWHHIPGWRFDFWMTDEWDWRSMRIVAIQSSSAILSTNGGEKYQISNKKTTS